MSYYAAWVTLPTSTGNFSMTSLPFTPTWARFTTGGKASGSDTASRHGVGFTDGTNEMATATLNSSTGYYTRSYHDNCVVILNTPGGVLAPKALASFVSFTTNQCTLNFSATDNEYEMLVEFGN